MQALNYESVIIVFGPEDNLKGDKFFGVGLFDENRGLLRGLSEEQKKKVWSGKPDDPKDICHLKLFPRGNATGQKKILKWMLNHTNEERPAEWENLLAKGELLSLAERSKELDFIGQKARLVNIVAAIKAQKIKARKYRRVLIGEETEKRFLRLLREFEASF